MEKATFNLCEGKGGAARSRIWLEKDRLTRAGFTHGKAFTKTWGSDKLVLEVVPAAQAAKLPREQRGTVCGSKARPIIDITGGLVRKTFAVHAQIAVTFDDGRITIRSASE